MDEAQAQRQLLVQGATALGVATEKDLRDYFRLDPADSRARLAELLESGELLACEVQGGGSRLTACPSSRCRARLAPVPCYRRSIR